MNWLVALFLSAGSLLGPVVSDAWSELCPLFPSEHERIGFNFSPLHGETASEFPVSYLQAGWYNDYKIQTEPDRPAGLVHVQTLFSGGRSTLSSEQKAELQAAVEANPGSIWLAGNEPDREGLQDNLLPTEYAQYYHEVYTFIKGIDPTARVATGGIVQATPIRLRYLDQVLAAYKEQYGKPMPVELWNIHNFVLREQLGSWGAGIPPGLEEYASEGKLYEVSDNGRFDLFKEQIIAFRKWMATNDYQNTPLIVSEFGILMPTFYGYPDDVVAKFLTDTFTFFLTEMDAEVGYPADNNRLVQAWSWFSLNERPYDLETERGFNGHLYDVTADRWTATGEAFADFSVPLVDHHTDVAVAAINADTGYFVPYDRSQITITVTVVNGGSITNESSTIELWYGNTPGKGGSKIGELQLSGIASHCRAPEHLAFAVSTAMLPVGTLPVWVRITPDDTDLERNNTNNITTGEFQRLAAEQQISNAWMPQILR